MAFPIIYYTNVGFGEIIQDEITQDEITQELINSIAKSISEKMPKEPAWMSLLTEREKQEIDFARIYTQEFNHGTDGHNRLVLINKLVDIINQDLIPAIE